MCVPYQLISVSDRLVPYAEGLAWQNAAYDLRRKSKEGDTMFVLEHSPVITIGRGSHVETDLFRSKQDLNQDGVQLFEADRGGELTYHGPGQLVVYPILQLEESRGERDLHEYLRHLEQVVIDSLNDVGLTSGRRPGLTGVWVGDAKIAAIGIKVSRWITMHGFSLNINVDLSPMRRDFVPCGIRDLGVTSLAELGISIVREEIEPIIIGNFERILHRRAKTRRGTMSKYESSS
jgi:lipoyl(octanoyl) transferase